MGITSWALGDKNYNTLQDLEAEYREKYPGMDTSGGVFSDARHDAASSLMSDRLGGGTTGDVLSNIGGFAREVPTFTSEVMGLTPWGQSWEDVQANAQAFSYPSNTAAADIYADVFSKYNANKGIPATNTGYQYGAAQAEDLTNLERDFPGMSTGDIIDSMNARQRANRFSGMGQTGPVKSNMAAPQSSFFDANPRSIKAQNQKAAFQELMSRQPGSELEQVNELGSPSRFQGFKNQMSNFMDNPVTRGLGTALNFARGSLPGMIMSGIGSLFSRNPNAPSYEKYTPGFNYNNLNESMINDFYDSNPDSDTFGTTRFDRAAPGSFGSFRTLAGYLNRNKTAAGRAAIAKEKQARKAAKAQDIARAAARAQQAAIEKDIARDSNRGGGANQAGGGYSTGSGYNEGNFCFDPSTPIQMADGSTKEIKNIQLGDDTKGGEVTGVFQFKATDEIHDYKGVTVAGSHYVKEDGKFIMVKDSPLSVKIDKIPVVYSLDTTGRRIFIKDIEFADYNGDGVAKNFLSNAGVDLTGFDTEVLRQVEQRLI